MKINSFFFICVILLREIGYTESCGLVASLDIDIDIHDTNFVQMKNIAKSKNQVRSLITANNSIKQVIDGSNNDQKKNDNVIEYEYEQEGLDSYPGNFVSHGGGIDIVLDEEPKKYFKTDTTPVEIVTPPFIPITPSRNEDNDDTKNQQNNTQDNKTNISTNINDNKTSNDDSENINQSSNIDPTNQTSNNSSNQQSSQTQIDTDEKSINTSDSQRQTQNQSTSISNYNTNNEKRDETQLTDADISSSCILFGYLYLVLALIIL